MIVSIARQSVVIKCNLASSIMTGNYEFYYAAGLLYRLKGVDVPEALEPIPLMEQVQQMITDFSPEEPRETHLIHMLRFYKPVEAFDDQMKELFEMGSNEQYPWQEL